MTSPWHFVSMRTYALAFAVALSPSVLQTAYSCERGNTELSNLEFEVRGQNLIQGFDYTQRTYAVSIDGSAAVATLRATSRRANSTVNWQWLVDGVGVDSGEIGVGGGEVPLLDIPPEGLSQLRVDVWAGEPGPPSATTGLTSIARTSLGVPSRGSSMRSQWAAAHTRLTALVRRRW